MGDIVIFHMLWALDVGLCYPLYEIPLLPLDFEPKKIKIWAKDYKRSLVLILLQCCRKQGSMVTILKCRLDRWR